LGIKSSPLISASVAAELRAAAAAFAEFRARPAVAVVFTPNARAYASDRRDSNSTMRS
jgi:hypothetical protein